MIKIYGQALWYNSTIKTPVSDEAIEAIPYPLHEKVPDWCKNRSVTTKILDGIEHLRMGPGAAFEYKSCPVPHNMLMKTVVIPAPCDITYGMDKGSLSILGASEWSIAIDGHPPNQLNGYAPGRTSIKFRMPYRIFVPKKMNVMFTTPFLHNEHFSQHFQTMQGLLSVSKSLTANINTLIDESSLVPERMYTVEAGTPLAYLIFPEYKGKVEVEIKESQHPFIENVKYRTGHAYKID